MEYEIELISKIVCNELGMDLKALKQKTRKREIVEARFLCFYFCHVEQTATFKEIGQYFGGMDHSSIIHGKDTMQDFIDTTKRFKKLYEDLLEPIKNRHESTQMIDPFSAAMLLLAKA
jgi:chromosomal replication initiator protein